MLRDLLLSGVLGAACAGAGTYILHRALWKTSDAQAKRIESLVMDSKEVNVFTTRSAFSSDRDPPETFEKYVKSRTGQAWNAMVDSLHMRLLKLPDTVRQVAQDASDAMRSGNLPSDVKSGMSGDDQKTER